MTHKWRDKIDSTVKTHLEKQIEDSAKYKEDYNKAINPANAQLWIALANLSKQLSELGEKVGVVGDNVKIFDKKVIDNLDKNLKELEKKVGMIKELEGKISDLKKASVKPKVTEEKPKKVVKGKTKKK